MCWGPKSRFALVAAVLASCWAGCGQWTVEEPLGEKSACVQPPVCGPECVCWDPTPSPTADRRHEKSLTRRRHPPKPVLDASCSGAARGRILVLPLRPWAGTTVRVWHVSRTKGRPDFLVVGPGGQMVEKRAAEHWGTVVRSWLVDLGKLSEGRYRVYVLRGGRVADCHAFVVSGSRPSRRAAYPEVWPVRRVWTPALEDFYASFVEHLFRARGGVAVSWPEIGAVFRMSHRNLLYGALGWNEDEGSGRGRVRVVADCADLPYVVRGYFSWKLGLPFSLRQCERGDPRRGPVCSGRVTNVTQDFRTIRDPVERFDRFMWMAVTSKVHSGHVRNLPRDQASDFYPVALSRKNLRPGLVFVDAAGHVILVVAVQWQGPARLGALYGVDAHPDRSVTRKRFSPGAFVFRSSVPTDGFKAFRPIVLRRGVLQALRNEELADPWPEWSDEQARLVASAFYRRVERILNPRPADPFAVLEAKVADFWVATLERRKAVDLGVQFMEARGWRPIAMPRGPAIFQTEGPWEAYSTPARDLRYLKQMDDLLGFPRYVATHPDRFRLPEGRPSGMVAHELEQRLRALLAARSFSYRRSDGSLWRLSLADVVARARALEMAYNPNDCPERRWGAPPGSQEAATCLRRAPLSQRDRMAYVRQWFRHRYRPGL